MYKKLGLLVLMIPFSLSQGYCQKTYIIIPEKTAKVNEQQVTGLPKNLKAMAALYSALGGTDCVERECALTKALGLGSQGSVAHKALIQQYFPDDKVAKLVLGQDCYLPPSGSSSFSNFLSLSFSVNQDTVRVNYRLAVYDHGQTKIFRGPDVYLFTNQVFRNRKRVLYAWVDKKAA